MASRPDEPNKPSSKDDKRYKMVLIGETGAGKTSFIELLLNYAKQFGLDSFNLKSITSFVNCTTTASDVKENESDKKQKVWNSDTTDSRKYQADFGEFKLDIIDTPGFADTRGEDQRKENVDNIINKVKEELYVNTVCLVISGTQVRLTSVMREVVEGIVSILPPEVLRNVIIVFTKTPDELSLKFDKKVLEEEFQLIIPKEYIFILDNPYTRYEGVKEMNARLTRTLSRNFEDAHLVLDDMFEVIKKFKPAVTIKFGEFHATIEEIATSLAKLGAFYENKRSMEKKMKEVDLNKVKKIEYEKIEVINSDQNNLVCTKSGCNSTCHKECDCWFTFMLVRACTKIRSGQCATCNHSIDYHYIVGYYFETTTHTILMPDEEKKSFLDKEMSSFDTFISGEVVALVQKLKKFQSLGSNGFFSKNAIKQIQHLKSLVHNTPGSGWKKEVNGMLDATLEVLQDPLTATHEDAKFLWACGILGVDPENASEEEVSKLFRQQAQRFHPDATNDESTTGFFKHINHAKEFLKKKLFK